MWIVPRSRVVLTLTWMVTHHVLDGDVPVDVLLGDQDLEVAHVIRPKLFETFNLVQFGGNRLNGWPDLSGVGWWCVYGR